MEKRCSYQLGRSYSYNTSYTLYILWAFYNKVLVKFWILLCTVLLLYLCPGRIGIFCCRVGEFLLLQHANVDPHLDRVGKQSLPFSIVSCKIYVTLLKVQQSFCSPLSAHDLIQLCISGGFLSVRNISKLKNHPKKTPTNWPQPGFWECFFGLSRYVSTQQLLVVSVAQGLQHSKWHLLAAGSRCYPHEDRHVISGN